jgi:hypothetical protein
MSKETTIILKRDDLYKLVWSESVHKLSKQHGLSDVGLAKACRKMGIPLPGRGYWAMKASGRSMPITPLPPVTENTIRQVTIHKQQEEVHKNPTPEDPDIIKHERFPENRITVAQNLYNPDILIEITERALKKARPDNYGRLSIFGKGCLDLRVSQGSLHRALLILDALIKALKQRGYAIAANPGETQITILGEQINVRLTEAASRSERALTREEMIQKKSDPLYYHSDRYLYTPTGKLSLVADYYGAHTLCSDTKGRSLEDSLNEGLIELIRFVLELKEARIIRERERIEQEEARQRRNIKEEQARKEQERYEALLKEAI